MFSGAKKGVIVIQFCLYVLAHSKNFKLTYIVQTTCIELNQYKVVHICVTVSLNQVFYGMGALLSAKLKL